MRAVKMLQLRNWQCQIILKLLKMCQHTYVLSIVHEDNIHARISEIIADVDSRNNSANV